LQFGNDPDAPQGSTGSNSNGSAPKTNSGGNTTKKP
jgi:hypothetical protein